MKILNIIQPPIQFQDKPIPSPIARINVEKMVPKYEDIIKKSIQKKNHKNQNTVFENQKKFQKFEPKLETIFENKLLNLDQISNIQKTKKALQNRLK